MLFTMVFLVALSLVGAVNAAVLPTLPESSAVLADGIKAGEYYLDHLAPADEYKCGWERGTYMLGMIELYKTSKHDPFLTYSKEWANTFDWKLCAKGTEEIGAPPGIENANNQLCGATYIELYKLDGMKNETMIAATKAEFDAEIADPSTSNYWSWVDAFFMAMNPLSRLGSVTGDMKYFDKMFLNFNMSALSGPDKKNTFHFWSDKYHLFYRDDNYLNSSVFWGRGNGWAMGALVAAIENSPPTDLHRSNYIDHFKMQAESLKKVQGENGCWHASLLNASGYPKPETTGSSCFTFGLAYGINKGILDKTEYMPVVTKAWDCLSKIALQDSGLFGYCQPVGASPEHNISPNSTSDFCVGQFMLAATEVSKLSPSV